MSCPRTLILLGWDWGPELHLVLRKYYIITNTKPGPESFPPIINLPTFCWAQRQVFDDDYNIWYIFIDWIPMVLKPSTDAISNNVYY